MTGDTHAAVRGHIRTLHDRAWHGLRHSQNLRPPLIDGRGMRFGRPRLQLWRTADGFHDYEPHTLTVFQPFDDAAPLLRKAIWNRSRDMEPLSEFLERRTRPDLPPPRPTFEVSDRAIDRSAFESLLGQAHDLHVPVVWPWPPDRQSVTTDVGTVGFEYFDLPEPQASLRCAWSADLPPEWHAVTDWFGRMSEWLESRFREGGRTDGRTGSSKETGT